MPTHQPVECLINDNTTDPLLLLPSRRIHAYYSVSSRISALLICSKTCSGVSHCPSAPRQPNHMYKVTSGCAVKES